MLPFRVCNLPILSANQQTWNFHEELLLAKIERKFIKECLVGQSASGFVTREKQDNKK